MSVPETIEIINCHTEGEVGDVIVGGVDPPPGKTLWEQRDFLERDRSLRDFVLNEPVSYTHLTLPTSDLV